MKKYLFAIGFGIVFLGYFTSSASAATITFIAPVGIALTSPTTTFMVASGSVTDVLTINATSAILSLSTGELFTLTSPSYDLSIVSSTGGGTVTNTCLNGLVTAALAQITGSTTYTIAPVGTVCSHASAPIISGIAANSSATTTIITWTTNIVADSTVIYGSSTSYGATSSQAGLVTAHSINLLGLSTSTTYHFAVVSSENGTSTISGDNIFITSSGTSGITVSVPSSGGSVASFPSSVSTGTTSINNGSSSQLALLLSTLCSLVIQAQAQNISIPQSLSNECSAGGSLTIASTTGAFQIEPIKLALSSSPLSSYDFARNLKFGMQGGDVIALQKFLVGQNKGPAARAVLRHGFTKNFASLTAAALKEFQRAVGISPASGYFGSITRAFIKGK